MMNLANIISSLGLKEDFMSMMQYGMALMPYKDMKSSEMDPSLTEAITKAIGLQLSDERVLELTNLIRQNDSHSLAELLSDELFVKRMQSVVNQPQMTMDVDQDSDERETTVCASCSCPYFADLGDCPSCH